MLFRMPYYMIYRYTGKQTWLLTLDKYFIILFSHSHYIQQIDLYKNNWVFWVKEFLL